MISLGDEFFGEDFAGLCDFYQPDNNCRESDIIAVELVSHDRIWAVGADCQTDRKSRGQKTYQGPGQLTL